MLALPKPKTILTHESDLDGFVSGLLLQRLARELFGGDFRLEANHNHSWKQRNLSEESAWVTDMSFEKRLDKPNWVIVDHHPTDLTPKFATLIHSPEKSASLLCYEICRLHALDSPALDRLVHLSNVADLFLEDDPDFALASDYANLVKIYGFWNLHDLIEGKLERLLDHPLLEVMKVKRRVEDPIGFEWSRGNVVELSPTVGLVNTVIGNTNLIVHRLLEEHATPFEVLLTLYRRGNGLILVSLRSRTGAAGQVAAVLQGGGHPNASGATLPRSIQQIPDAVDYLKRVLNPASERIQRLNSLESAFAALDAR